jgi:hypothetical protein
VVENVDDFEMRVIFAKVLAAAAFAVLVAEHLLKLGAHLTTALARLQVHNLARSRSLEVGNIRDNKGVEEWENIRNFVGQFSTGTRKCRWRARAYFPNGINKFFFRPLEL